MSKTFARSAFAVLALACALAVPGQAAQPKEPVRDLDVKAFFVPELSITSSHADARGGRSRALPNREAWESFLGGAREGFANPADVGLDRSPLRGGDQHPGRVSPDPRQRRREPLTLTACAWARARGGRARWWRRRCAASSTQHAALLGIDVAQLGEARVTQINADLWQVHIPQVYQGIPCATAHLAASISHGNLVTIGDRHLGQRRRARPRGRRSRPKPRCTPASPTRRAGRGGRDPRSRAHWRSSPSPPSCRPPTRRGGAARPGYRHRLVWSLRVPAAARRRALGDPGRRAHAASCSRCRTSTTTCSGR